MQLVSYRTILISASLLVAAALFFVLDDRNGERNSVPEPPEETTVQAEISRSLYGAAAYFPQGTNPPIGVERSDAVSSEAEIFLEEARREGTTVSAFGTFTGGRPECALISEDSVETPARSDIEVAGDTFLFTATPDSPGGDHSVRCAIAGRFFRGEVPEAVRKVEPSG